MSDIFIIDAESSEGVEQQLKDAKQKMLKNLDSANTLEHHVPADFGDEIRKDPTSFAVVINGFSLVRNFSCEP